MTQEEILLRAMKSYATKKIDETKENIKKKKPSGLNESMSLEDTFEMKVIKSEDK